jgi:uncharacterized protein (TIGR02444 family)
MTDRTTETLWQFALRFYAAPAVQAACLDAQDEVSADVPLMIFLIFAATHGQTLGEEGIRTIDEAISPWREDIVQPLRRARRALRGSDQPGAQRLREAVKAAELESERLQIERLATYVTGERVIVADEALRIAEQNLHAYARLLPDMAERHCRALLTCMAKLAPSSID